VIVDLSEYESVERALATDHAEALAATNVVRVQRAWSAGSFVITANSIVGNLRVLEDLQLRVRPKLPVRRVIYLLAHAAGLAAWDDRILDVQDEDPLDVAVAAAFTYASERSLARGAHSSYYAVEAALNEVRGRLDVADQQRRFGFPIPVSVRYDEYGIDVLENQLVLGAASRVQRLPGLSLDVRRRLRRIVAALDGVRPADRQDAIKPVLFTRINRHYEAAVALSRAVLTGRSFDLPPGRRASIGFTVDMNRLFEAFLSVALRDALERRYGGRLHAQRHDYLDKESRVTIIPDLTWIRSKSIAAVVDAKYKALDKRPADPDLYQVVSYCLSLGIRDAYLVHGTASDGPKTIRVRGGICIHVVVLDLAASLPALRSQIEALAEEIGCLPAPAEVGMVS